MYPYEKSRNDVLLNLIILSQFHKWVYITFMI